MVKVESIFIYNVDVQAVQHANRFRFLISGEFIDMLETLLENIGEIYRIWDLYNKLSRMIIEDRSETNHSTRQMLKT